LPTFLPPFSSRKPFLNGEFHIFLLTLHKFAENSKFIMCPTRVERRGSGRDGPSVSAFCATVLFSRKIRFTFEIGEHGQAEEAERIKEKN
jgi:hypothetical protein